MDADGGGLKGRNGAIAQLWDCNSNSWQQWVMTGDGHIKSRYDGRCLDADGGGLHAQNGAIIQLWDCNSNAWQKWTVGADRKIRSVFNNRCLDADRNGTRSQQGALLQLWDCNSNAWQTWPNSLFRLGSGQQLAPGDALVNGSTQLEMQTDGNLVVFGLNHVAVWATGTNQAGSTLEMQTDGNLVVYAPGHVAVWATGTNQAGSSLDMQSDNNLVVFAPGRAVMWASAQTGGRQQIAQEILNNSRITLAVAHASGISDSAYARSNIVSTAGGGAAVRSSYDADGSGGYPAAPGGTVLLSTAMLSGLRQLGVEGAMRVSEIAGGQHTGNSQHYYGRAFDLDQYGGRAKSALISRCQQLGANLAQDEGTHVHCQWPS
ncbi:peptidoglycan binding domain-containing protein [Actinoplanes sp. N902-109]|nr:peptidoglycan binding domain-containing protein [Actinoplanes sp. N902-109]